MGGWQRLVRATFYFTAGYVLIPASVPVAFLTGKKRGEQLMNRARPRSVRAFSLVEMIVVVSIIAILLSLAGVGAVSWINSAKVTATTTTLKSLKAAIDEFVNARPIQDRPIDTDIPYTVWFGNLPPCPVTPWNTSGPGSAKPYSDDAPIASKQFDHLMLRFLMSAGQGNPRLGAPSPDYASIECLALFLSQCSPQSKSLVEKLPTANTDKDTANLMSGNGVPLLEIIDAWDQPLRWAVWPHDMTLPGNQNLPELQKVRWELRSAGKDGKFAAAFTPKEQCDDVILQGP